MAAGYRLLEHPADLGVEARGRSLKEAFEQAALGLIAVVVEPETIEPLQKRELRLSASDVEILLVKFLSEILFWYDADAFLTAAVDITELNANNIHAVVRGEKIRPEKHRIRTDVKAVTYHQLSVRHERDEWIATVYLDI